MYLQFFGLTEKPFHTTPDPRFLYSSSSHREALAALIYSIEQRQGFVTIIGEVGVGKTLILRAFLELVNSELDQTVYIYNSNLSFKALLREVLDELDQQPRADDVDTMIHQLQEVLIAQYRKKGTIVLLIDEAQNMPIATLENLRMLSNIETTTDKLLQIVLIGQPELDTLLSERALRQLRQRITHRATIQPLTKSESIEYIRHRLAKAGARPSSVLTKQAINSILKEAKGIPRLLNILCDATLLTGFGYQEKPISAKTAKEVISDFQGKSSYSIWRWVPSTIAALLLIVAIYWVQTNDFDFSPQNPTNRMSTQDTRVGPFSKSEKSRKNEEKNLKKKSEEPRPSRPSSLLPKSAMINPVHSTSGITSDTLPSAVLASQTKGKLPINNDPGIGNSIGNNEVKKVKKIDHKEKVPSMNKQLLAINKNPLHNSNGIKNSDQQLNQVIKPAIYAKSSTKRQLKASSLEGSENTPQTSHRQYYTIKRGDTLDSLLRTIYGRSSPKHMNKVLGQNPHIKSPSRLYPGQKITFPLESHEPGN
ncbi:MAG: AAA family ATPase [Nitrospirales bacterium]